MFEPQKLSRQLSQKISFSLGSGIVVWVLLLLHGANVMRDKLGSTHLSITAGPLSLNELTKTQTPSGFVVSLSFKPGIIIFAAGWLTLGLLWAYLMYKVRDHILKE